MIDFEKYMIAEEGLFSKFGNRNKHTQKKEDEVDMIYEGEALSDMIYKGILSLEKREANNLNKPNHLLGDKAGLDYIKEVENSTIKNHPNFKIQLVHGKRLHGIVVLKEGINRMSSSKDIKFILFPKKDESGKIKNDAFLFSTLVYYYKTDVLKYMNGEHD